LLFQGGSSTFAWVQLWTTIVLPPPGITGITTTSGLIGKTFCKRKLQNTGTHLAQAPPHSRFLCLQGPGRGSAGDRVSPEWE
jgi:hypothetical protein